MGFFIFALRVLVCWFFAVAVRKTKPGGPTRESFWVVLRALEAAYREHRNPSGRGHFTGGGDVDFRTEEGNGIVMRLRPARRKDRRGKAYTLSTRNPQTGSVNWDLDDFNREIREEEERYQRMAEEAEARLRDRLNKEEREWYGY